MDDIKKAVDLLLNSKKIFVLTGAGISTESGIPDFRSSTGYYSKLDASTALSKDILLRNPKRFYQEGYLILNDINGKEPNAGHRVLAELEKRKLIDGIITQNIDNLHIKAGSRNVYEVHGETRGAHCLNCGNEVNFSVIKDKVDHGQIPPKCDKCGGTLRPNVVMFGDMMPDDFSRAMYDMKNSDLLIVIGSSLTVSPVNYLPQYAKKLIIINNDPTPEDKNAELVFHESAGNVLEKILEEVRNRE